MDSRRFDDLTRSLARGTSRRGVLKSLGVGLAAALGMRNRGPAGALTCRDAGRRCASNGHCCSGLCDPGTMTCVCPPGTENCRGECKNPTTDYQTDPLNCGGCNISCPRTQCSVAVCNQGQCALAPDPVMLGRGCDDNNCCTVDDTCRLDGACRGEPKPCSRAPKICEGPGTCNPATCDCAFPLLGPEVVCRAVNGDCDVAERCTGSSPDCPPDAFQLSTVQCRPGSGVCDPPDNCPGNGPHCPPNSFPSTDVPCETGNLCTADHCNGIGQCVQGPVSVQCPAPTQCQQSVTCNPATGLCTNIVNKASDAPCNADGNACTAEDHCDGAGTCVAGTPVTCRQPTQCELSVACNPQTGICDVITYKLITATCNADNNACTVDDHCDGAGNCVAGPPETCATCTACNPQTGTCDPTANGQPGPDCTTLCCNSSCCAAGETCVGNQCTAPTTTSTTTSTTTTTTTQPPCIPNCAGRACGDADDCGGTCQTGNCPVCQICDDGQCIDDQVAGETGVLCAQPGPVGPFCDCRVLVEGGVACVDDLRHVPCIAKPPCATSEECDSGFVCAFFLECAPVGSPSFCFQVCD